MQPPRQPLAANIASAKSPHQQPTQPLTAKPPLWKRRISTWPTSTHTGREHHLCSDRRTSEAQRARETAAPLLALPTEMLDGAHPANALCKHGTCRQPWQLRAPETCIRLLSCGAQLSHPAVGMPIRAKSGIDEPSMAFVQQGTQGCKGSQRNGSCVCRDHRIQGLGCLHWQ